MLRGLYKKGFLSSTNSYALVIVNGYTRNAYAFEATFFFWNFVFFFFYVAAVFIVNI